jgi:hypothetical protein
MTSAIDEEDTHLGMYLAYIAGFTRIGSLKWGSQHHWTRLRWVLTVTAGKYASSIYENMEESHLTCLRGFDDIPSKP